jgi:hypothetical protein
MILKIERLHLVDPYKALKTYKSIFPSYMPYISCMVPLFVLKRKKIKQLPTEIIQIKRLHLIFLVFPYRKSDGK